MFYVYAHFDYKGNCFYIGKGKGNRVNSKIGRNKYWKNVANRRYKAVIIENFIYEQDALQFEIDLIARYNPRCNFTAGGAGGFTYGKLPKEKLTNAIKKAHKGLKKYWQTITPEERQKRSKISSQTLKNTYRKLGPEKVSKMQSLRTKNRKVNKVLCITENIIFNNVNEAAKYYGFKYPQHITRVCNGNRPSAKGLVFCYVKENK